MVIQAAMAGLGLAVLPRFLIQEELGSGRLVVAFDRPVTSRHAYYLVHPERKADLRRVVAFREWLLAACAAYEAKQASSPRPSRGLRARRSRA
jgi:DNA-binding transcriptional LysR family regulator